MANTTRKLNMTEDKILQLLKSEIEYCKKHPDKELSEDYQKGFIGGLEQAIRFIGI